MRTVTTVSLADVELFQQQLLQWAQQFEDVLWLDSNTADNHGSLQYKTFDAVLAAEGFTSIRTDYHNAFEKLHEYQSNTDDWIFGYLAYDLKNDTERLTSENFDGLDFPELCFFQPQKLFFFKGNTLEIHYLNMIADEATADLEEIKKVRFNHEPLPKGISIKARISKELYMEKVKRMLEHIHRGDIYEANFCQEFYAENTEIAPLDTYKKLNAISKPPFAAFLKIGEKYLLSATPERYLKKAGNKVISQPIKGTARRAKEAAADLELADELKNSEKERSENIMITDLVRNDLSKTALKNSVQVEELCGLYTFRQVHQLVSTITSLVAAETNPAEILKTTFPMGSMTGAPKIRAMQIIEDVEETKRGLFSGAVGYISPNNDFDFNVVIRSILYDKNSGYASFSVGSAITAKSIPENEYEECLLKAKAMREVLEKAEHLPE